jgi:hypothetical protein
VISGKEDFLALGQSLFCESQIGLAGRLIDETGTAELANRDVVRQPFKNGEFAVSHALDELADEHVPARSRSAQGQPQRGGGAAVVFPLPSPV